MHGKTIQLANGVEAPALGFGTWLIPDERAQAAASAAIRVGYRHIDTAQAYGNERGVGEAIRTCGLAREEIFVTSKVAAEHKTYESAAASIDESLNAMGLDYLDLMIIHSPQPWKEVNQSTDRHVEGNRQAWRALEDALAEGKVRAIGISNFLEEDIESLLQAVEVTPMVNQVLCHIANTPIPLFDYCQEKGIVMEAYSPLGHGESLKNPAIKAVADAYGVTAAQLCIRYTLQLGAISLPKTESPDRMAENAEVDFEISAEDMQILKDLEHIEGYGEHGHWPVYGGKF